MLIFKYVLLNFINILEYLGYNWIEETIPWYIFRGLRTSNSPESPTPISKRQRLKSFTTKLRRRLSNSIYTTPEDNGSTQSLPTDFDAIFHDLSVFNEDAVV